MIFCAHILGAYLRHATNFHLIIPKFNKVMLYDALSPREFSHFRKH